MTMRNALLAATIILTSCSGQDGQPDNYPRMPLTVAGVTYKWPSSSSSSGTPRKGGISFALLPKRLWNQTVGTVSTMRFPDDKGDLTIWLGSAKVSEWAIRSDGSGLPDGINFSSAKPDGEAIVGTDVQPMYANPPTIVIFKNESEAYVECIGAEKLRPLCHIFMNDRGVKHTLPAAWGRWGEIPVALKLYRGIIGAPNPK